MLSLVENMTKTFASLHDDYEFDPYFLLPSINGDFHKDSHGARIFFAYKIGDSSEHIIVT